jgi:hypothetical protein
MPHHIGLILFNLHSFEVKIYFRIVVADFYNTINREKEWMRGTENQNGSFNLLTSALSLRRVPQESRAPAFLFRK